MVASRRHGIEQRRITCPRGRAEEEREGKGEKVVLSVVCKRRPIECAPTTGTWSRTKQNAEAKRPDQA